MDELIWQHQQLMEKHNFTSEEALNLIRTNVIRMNNAALIESLGHEICMGMRKALFGAHASDHATIDNTFQQKEY